MAEQVTTQKIISKDHNEHKPMQGLLSQAPARAILVSIETPEPAWPINESLDELKQLAETAGITCVDRIVQRLETPHSATVLGSGKVTELAELAIPQLRCSHL